MFSFVTIKSFSLLKPRWFRSVVTSTLVTSLFQDYWLIDCLFCPCLICWWLKCLPASWWFWHGGWLQTPALQHHFVLLLCGSCESFSAFSIASTLSTAHLDFMLTSASKVHWIVQLFTPQTNPSLNMSFRVALKSQHSDNCLCLAM